MEYETYIDLPGIITLTPKVFGDNRGFFFESYNKKTFESISDFPTEFVQDNHSKSEYGVIRGIHYQLNPFAQGKLIRVIKGEIFNIAVDLRKSSKYFKKHLSFTLSAENKKQLWIPPGFGNGFMCVSSECEIIYKTTDYYAPDHQHIVRWDDPEINIKWPIEDKSLAKLSERDKNAPLLKDAKLFD